MTVVERTALAMCDSFGGCAATGHERHHLMCAYLRPAQALADQGLLLGAPVIELKNCGNHAGLFATREGAKAEAQKRLDEYHEMYAEAEADPEEDDLSYEPLITDTLTWEVKRIDHRGLPSEHPEMGWEREVAFYSKENGYFTLHEQEVGP